MRSFRKTLVLALAFALVPTLTNAEALSKKETIYEGTWVTTNRRLDGRMTCVVTEAGENRWTGHFYGVWQGVEFSYKVNFNGPPEKNVGDGRDRWSRLHMDG